MASKKSTKRVPKKAAKPVDARTFMEKADQTIETGEKLLKTMTSLDDLIRKGMQKFLGEKTKPKTISEEYTQRLEQENVSMRRALCALLVEAGSDVRFKPTKLFDFDVVWSLDHIEVRRRKH